LPDDVTVTSDGAIQLDDSSSVTLASTPAMNELSNSGVIELDVNNTTQANISAIVFRKGEGWDRLPYIDADLNAGRTLSWPDAKTSETISFQLLKSKVNLFYHLVDSNGLEHIIDLKNTTTRVRGIFNTGQFVHVKIAWGNKQLRIFLQDVDGNGDPMFDTEGNPVMVNISGSLSITNASDSSVVEGQGTDYNSYLSSIGGLATLDTTDPDDVFVQFGPNVDVKTSDANITIGSMTAEKYNLTDLQSDTDVQASATFNADGLFVKDIKVTN
jgi:hypothetical protein